MGRFYLEKISRYSVWKMEPRTWLWKWFNVIRDTSNDKIGVYKMRKTSDWFVSENFRSTETKFLDKTNKISFKYNGKKYYGYKGDTLASALLSNEST